MVFCAELSRHKFSERFANKIGVRVRGHRYSLIGCAFDFLFEKTPAFERTLLLARESLNFKPNVPRIGIHIRMGDAASFRPASLDQRTSHFQNFFTCAKEARTKNREIEPRFYSRRYQVVPGHRQFGREAVRIAYVPPQGCVSFGKS